MGYRLHYARKYEVEWGGGTFNWQQENWEKLFDENFSENGWQDELGMTCGIDRNDVKKYLKKLQGLNPLDKSKYFDDYTVKDELNAFKDMLENTKDQTIQLNWF